MKFNKVGRTVATVAATIIFSGCSASDIQTIVSGGEARSTTSVTHPPLNPDNVKIYYSNVPKHYQVIGRVSANNDNALGIPHSEQSIENELKKQAASLGANGVINISDGHEQTKGDAVIIKK